MSSPKQPQDIFQSIADFEASLENPHLASAHQLLRSKLRDLLEEFLRRPDLPAFIKEAVEQKLQELQSQSEVAQNADHTERAENSTTNIHTTQGQGINQMLGGTINNYFDRLPEEDQRRLATWVLQWITDELGLDSNSGVSRNLAAILVNSPVIEGHSIQEFGSVSKIISSFAPTDLSKFYEGLDENFPLLQIQWIDVANLLQVLQQPHIPADWVSFAYHTAHPTKDDPLDEVLSMVYRLAQRFYQNEEQHPLCTFVSVLMARMGETQQQRGLRDWLRRMSNERGVKPKFETVPQKPFKEAYIVVAIKLAEQSDSGVVRVEHSFPAIFSLPEYAYLFRETLEAALQKRFHIDVWVCDEDGDLRYSQPSYIDEQYTVDQLLPQIRNKIQKAIQSIVVFQKDHLEIVVEFELERDWLLCEVEHLPLEEITPIDLEDGILPTPIGYDYPVTVRMHRQPVHLKSLAQKWSDWEKKSCVLESCDITPISQAAHSHRAHLFQQFEHSYAALMTFVSDDHRVYRRVFYYASERGIPLALCPRPNMAMSEEPFVDTLWAILQTNTIESIRTKILQHRRHALGHQDHFGHHLILLWNDPKRHPNPREHTTFVSWGQRQNQ